MEGNAGSGVSCQGKACSKNEGPAASRSRFLSHGAFTPSILRKLGKDLACYSPSDSRPG